MFRWDALVLLPTWLNQSKGWGFLECSTPDRKGWNLPGIRVWVR